MTLNDVIITAESLVHKPELTAGIHTRVFAIYWGTRWRSWLSHCATSQKVACSIPDGVIGHNPSGRTMALVSTQPLTEMSTRNISWGGGGKDGRCVGLTTLLSSRADCLKIREPQPPRTLRACPGL